MFFKVFKKTLEKSSNRLTRFFVHAQKGNTSNDVLGIFSFIAEKDMQKHNIFAKMSYFCGDLYCFGVANIPLTLFGAAQLRTRWQLCNFFFDDIYKQTCSEISTRNSMCNH
jgi:hypothetical protein